MADESEQVTCGDGEASFPVEVMRDYDGSVLVVADGNAVLCIFPNRTCEYVEEGAKLGNFEYLDCLERYVP